MLIMRGDLVEFILQRPHPRDTMHELEVAFALVVHACVVDDCVASRFVDPPRDIERHLRIVESRSPSILIKGPKDLARLAEDSANALEKNRLAIGEVVENKSDGPLAWSICARQIERVEREVSQRLVSGFLEVLYELHTKSYSDEARRPRRALVCLLLQLRSSGFQLALQLTDVSELVQSPDALNLRQLASLC